MLRPNKVIKFLESKNILYSTPTSETMKGWREWRDKVRKEHPIQYAIRERAGDIWYCVKRAWYDMRARVKYTFKPPHKLVRDAMPKREWSDLSTLITSINFAIIQQFKLEADSGFVDWTEGEDNVKFKNWLDSANDWIVNGRPALLKQISAAYPPMKDVGDFFCEIEECQTPDAARASYDARYKDVITLEKVLEDTDEAILKGLIEHREYFWT